MAKIKQQRLRRFKSVQEPSTEVRWDTNCITPGTDFMRKLSKRLETLCGKHSGWTLSDDLEPGEGEHKIMNIFRESELEGPVFVYGLDADLILLSLLNAPKNTYLMREDSEMGVVNVNQFGEESYSFFSLEALSNSLWPTTEVSYEEILEYVTAMSFLGNDFLPHSLSIKIRDEGHSFLIKELSAMHQAGLSLVEKTTLLKMNYKTVAWLLERWSLLEEDRLLHSFKKKIQMRGQENPVEFRVVDCQQRVWSLKKGWEDVYRKEWAMCQTHADIAKCCEEYFVGLQWVLDYYTGQRTVNRTWFYPRLVPPLWRDLANHLQNNPIPEPPSETVDPIQPHEQLAMVLPLQSWHHLPQSSPLRSLPSLLPQFWPEQFDFFTAGRIYAWEYEPLLPILPLATLRKTSQKQTLN